MFLLELTHNVIYHWKGLDKIYHVTTFGDPVSYWVRCVKIFVHNIHRFYSLGTRLRVQQEPLAQRLLAPFSPRGESTSPRQRPENTPSWRQKYPPGLVLPTPDAPPPETYATAPLDWPNFKSRGELSPKHCFLVLGDYPPSPTPLICPGAAGSG